MSLLSKIRIAYRLAGGEDAVRCEKEFPESLDSVCETTLGCCVSAVVRIVGPADVVSTRANELHGEVSFACDCLPYRVWKGRDKCFHAGQFSPGLVKLQRIWHNEGERRVCRSHR